MTYENFVNSLSRFHNERVEAGESVGRQHIVPKMFPYNQVRAHNINLDLIEILPGKVLHLWVIKFGAILIYVRGNMP